MKNAYKKYAEPKTEPLDTDKLTRKIDSFCSNLSLEELFIWLTRTVGPKVNESSVHTLIPEPYTLDKHGNVWVQVYNEDGTLPRVLFLSHCDTVRDHVQVDHQFYTNKNGDKIITTDGKSILGADCRIGVAIMIKMILGGVPGTYIFCSEEETGRQGSSRIARHLAAYYKDTIAEGEYPFDYAISFDRRGTNSIITDQMGSSTASDEFAEALAEHIAWLSEDDIVLQPDPTGSFTDSYSFRDIVPECTNISVGYENAHSVREEQNITFATKLLECLLEVDWENLPVERDPTVKSDRYDYLDSHYGRGWTKTRAGKYTYIPPKDSPTPPSKMDTTEKSVVKTDDEVTSKESNNKQDITILKPDYKNPPKVLDDETNYRCTVCGTFYEACQQSVIDEEALCVNCDIPILPNEEVLPS